MSHWPLFDLSVSTPRLELRYATDAMLLELADAADDVIAPGSTPFEEGASFYDLAPRGRRRWLSGQWAARGRTSPEWWVLVFAVVVEGKAVGTQEMTGADFRTLRTVESFSWLTRSYQGQGLGREMRAAMLQLAFAGLGALQARSDAFEDNAASVAVSTGLGYEHNGTSQAARPGGAAPMVHFSLTREKWLPRRRNDIEIRGLEPCLTLLGLA